MICRSWLTGLLIRTKPFLTHWRTVSDNEKNLKHALIELEALIQSAEVRYPNASESKYRLEALVEEVGEAVRDAVDDNKSGPFENKEWLDVACVAMRAYIHGTPDIKGSIELVDALICLEVKARLVQ
jgi:hypothetical protein